MAWLARLTSQVRGGLTFREGHYICEAIYESGLLVALDLMVRHELHAQIASLTMA
jgi:arginase